MLPQLSSTLQLVSLGEHIRLARRHLPAQQQLELIKQGTFIFRF